jgi:hypothetical protein
MENKYFEEKSFERNDFSKSKLATGEYEEQNQKSHVFHWKASGDCLKNTILKLNKSLLKRIAGIVYY